MAVFRDDAGGVSIQVKVQPRAARNEVCGVHGEALKVRVTAPPVDSAANEALVRFLADQLHCAHGAVQLVRGGTSRHKVVYVRGLNAARAAELLGVR